MSTQWGGSITEVGLEAVLTTHSQGGLRAVYGVTQLGLMEGNTSDASCCPIPSGMTASGLTNFHIFCPAYRGHGVMGPRHMEFVGTQASSCS